MFRDPPQFVYGESNGEKIFAVAPQGREVQTIKVLKIRNAVWKAKRGLTR